MYGMSPKLLLLFRILEKDTGSDIKSGRMPGDVDYGVEMLTR
jgi:hypothetical protein